MANSSGWLTIKQMRQEILFETEREQGFYKKCMHHVINGVRDLNMFHVMHKVCLLNFIFF